MRQSSLEEPPESDHLCVPAAFDFRFFFFFPFSSGVVVCAGFCSLMQQGLMFYRLQDPMDALTAKMEKYPKVKMGEEID